VCMGFLLFFFFFFFFWGGGGGGCRVLASGEMDDLLWNADDQLNGMIKRTLARWICRSSCGMGCRGLYSGLHPLNLDGLAHGLQNYSNSLLVNMGTSLGSLGMPSPA
jgi:hypothetical protein